MTRTTEELLKDVQTKLELARKAFNEYSQLHAAKNTHAGIDKSTRNNLFALEMRIGLEALAELSARLSEREEEPSYEECLAMRIAGELAFPTPPKKETTDA